MTIPIRSIAVLSMLVLGRPNAASAQIAAPDYRQVVDSAVSAGVPGAQAVVIDHEHEWAYAAGVRSVETGTPLRLSDRMRIASITKVFTYATIMQLVSAGQLAPGDLAVRRLPDDVLAGVPHAERITIDQLLQHTSGIHNFNGDNGADFFRALYGDPDRRERRWSAEELIAFARRPGNPPTGLPGESRSYSSTGYIVLERVAEHTAGIPLPALYRQLILDPLGMRRTGVDGYDLDARDIVDSYGRRDSTVRDPSAFTGRRPVRADGLVNLSAGITWYNAWARGAGAVASTACDLGQLARAIRANRLTVISDQRDELIRVATRPTATFAWNGGTAGVQATMLYAPAQDIIIVVLTNGTGVGPGSNDIARRLLEAARARAASGQPVRAPGCYTP